MQLNGNCIYALSHYLIHRTALAPSSQQRADPPTDAFLAQKYPLLYSFCFTNSGDAQKLIWSRDALIC
ncbi:hypothetical protein KCP77_22970 [Salmonella enterica subsp. enterica]|nr:hypothetical protein KCP77_22970 [Salmonella enterica subsp. enterica]